MAFLAFYPVLPTLETSFMMLQLFQKFRKRIPKRTYQLPADCRVYAVGDIHGRADLLKLLHHMIKTDVEKAAESKKNRIVYLGDYLDRGPHAREVLEAMISGSPDGFQADHLMGNHEAIFLNFMADSSFLALWLDLGGQSTLMNYRIKPPIIGFSRNQAEAVRQALLEAMPREHLTFLQNLKPFVRVGDYVFVHAGIRPGIALERQSRDDLLWIRDEFTHCQQDFGQMIVHGHTINPQVQQRPNRIGIDTGAYATGYLTCAVIEDDRVRFLSATSRV